MVAGIWKIINFSEAVYAGAKVLKGSKNLQLAFHSMECRGNKGSASYRGHINV